MNYHEHVSHHWSLHLQPRQVVVNAPPRTPSFFLIVPSPSTALQPITICKPCHHGFNFNLLHSLTTTTRCIRGRREEKFIHDSNGCCLANCGRHDNYLAKAPHQKSFFQATKKNGDILPLILSSIYHCDYKSFAIIFSLFSSVDRNRIDWPV